MDSTLKDECGVHDVYDFRNGVNYFRNGGNLFRKEDNFFRKEDNLNKSCLILK